MKVISPLDGRGGQEVILTLIQGGGVQLYFKAYFANFRIPLQIIIAQSLILNKKKMDINPRTHKWKGALCVTWRNQDWQSLCVRKGYMLAPNKVFGSFQRIIYS